jgi:hypothetical protein
MCGCSSASRNECCCFCAWCSYCRVTCTCHVHLPCRATRHACPGSSLLFDSKTQHSHSTADQPLASVTHTPAIRIPSHRSRKSGACLLRARAHGARARRVSSQQARHRNRARRRPCRASSARRSTWRSPSGTSGTWRRSSKSARTAERGARRALDRCTCSCTTWPS